MTKLTKRLCLDLSDTLSGDLKLLTNLLEGSGTTVLKSETKLNYLLLSGSKSVKNVAELLTEKRVGCAV